MRLVPINDQSQTETFTIEREKFRQKELKKISINDPQQIIPSGMYAIIVSHKKSIIFAISFYSSVFISLIGLLAYFGVFLHTGWFVYIFPIAASLIFAYKLILLILEYNSFNKWISRYREDIQYELTSAPQFLDTIYVKLLKNQVTHNWISFISLFYLSIFTLTLWGLQEKSWWIFHFNVWIKDIFKDPKLIIILLVVTIFIICITYVYCSIARKKQQYRIDNFFGGKVVSNSEIIQMKSTLNKAWKRGFILSLIIILVIPFIVKWILKLLTKR